MGVTPKPASHTVAETHAANDRYRILLPLERGGGLPGMLHFALPLARAINGELLVLHVITPDDSDTDGASAPPSADTDQFADVPHEIITTRAETIGDGILDVARERECDLILLAWRGQPRGERDKKGRILKIGRILDPVVVDAPCDVALIKGEFVRVPEELAPQRILLAAGGGPNMSSAARLAFALARFHQGKVTLVNVVPEDADDAVEAEAYETLDRIVAEAGIDREEVETLAVRRVIRADKAAPAIIAAANDHDIVFLGASGATILNQLFLGEVNEQVAKELALPFVIVRRYPGLAQFWLRRLWRHLQTILPSVSEAEGLDTYKRIRRGARGTINFYTMMLLSIIIATMGLLLNSGAVIIGAMLVAPLMTPILALGLSVVTGDIQLLKVAGKSTALAILLAIVVSTLLTWIAPFALFTDEVRARTHPNLFDLIVAISSGAAGAFAMSRKEVAAALPGVAIAAALVPPLDVIGICLATGRWAEAAGAALLFGSNIIAASFAAVVVYLLLGFFPEKEEQVRHWVLRYGFLAGLSLLFIITVPLARNLEQDVREATLNRTLRNSLEEVLGAQSHLSLFNFDWEASPGQPVFLRVVVYTRGDVTTEMLNTIKQAVSNEAGREINLQLVAIPVSELGQ